MELFLLLESCFPKLLQLLHAAVSSAYVDLYIACLINALVVVILKMSAVCFFDPLFQEDVLLQKKKGVKKPQRR